MNLTFRRKVGYGFIIFLALLFLLPPFEPSSHPYPVTIRHIPYNLNGTTLEVRGYSPYDALDRVVLIMDGNIEVARIITPLHRDGSLPNHFNDLVNIPFPLRNDSLNWLLIDAGQVWNVTMANLGENDKLTAHIEQVKYPTTTHQGENGSIFIPHTETVYWLVSGHNQLESIGDLTMTIDGKSYHVFDWHPLNNDFQLTSVGVVIPYIVTNLTAGYHFVDMVGTPRYNVNGETYFILSAFGVCYSSWCAPYNNPASFPEPPIGGHFPPWPDYGA